MSKFKKQTHRPLRLVVGALVAALSLTALPAIAAPACPPGLPPAVFCGGEDITAATAGTYALDPAHAAVVAKVSHLGYSYSVFRFDKLEGSLTWDPAAPERSKLAVTVETASIATNVPGFATQLSGDGYLKSQAFPKATFVSTAFRRSDATRGKVDGTLALMGKTVPITFDVTLVGAGKGFGKPRLGVEARAMIDPASIGLPPVLNQPIQLVVDAEFERKS